MRTLSGLLGLLALVALPLAQMGCSDDAQSQPPEEETVPALPVEAAAVTTGNISAFFSGTATLEAEEEAQVVAKTGGIVAQIFVEEGHYVKAGQPLAQLDDERLALELARTEAALRKLEREYERNGELHQKKLISTEEYERVRSDFEAQKAAFDLAKLSVDYTTIVAPISGTISERLIKVGNMVQTHAPTFRITDFDPLLAVIHAPERELNKLRAGQAATLRADALPGTTFNGKIKRISPIVDATTGTFKVTVEVRDRTRQLKPGMFGRVGIVYDTHEGAMLIPKQAVIEEDNAASVFVIRDSMALRQSVQTGYSEGATVEILSGLSVGDRIITTGQSNLRDSTKVDVINL